MGSKPSYFDYGKILLQALKDNKLPTPVKFMLGLGVAYLISPVDIIPDIAGPLGFSDDLAIAAILIGLGGKIIYKKMKNQDSNQDDNVIDM